MRNPSIIHRPFGIIHRPASNGNAARERDQRHGAVSAYSVQSIDNPSTELRNPSTDTLPNLSIIGQPAGKNIATIRNETEQYPQQEVVSLGRGKSCSRQERES